MSDSVGSYGPSLVKLLCPGDSPGKNTGVGCHVLLQEIYAYFVPTSYLQEITLIYCEYIQRCMKISFELVLIIVYYYVQFRQLF